MIIDQLKNASYYYRLNEGLAKGLRYLQQTDLNRLESGTYEIDGKRLYAMVQEPLTKPKDQGFWEAHQKHMDIHCVIQGQEQIGYAPIDALTPGEYDGEKDLWVLEGQGAFFMARSTSFVVLFPQDAHMPGIAVEKPEKIKKVVVKIVVGPLS